MALRLIDHLLLWCLAVLSFGSIAFVMVEPAVAQGQSERIDVLEKLIASQQEQLNALQAQLTELLALREEAPPPLPARLVTSSSDSVGLSIYGQVNRGVLFVDDGHTQKFFNVDNDLSSTRLGLDGVARPREGA